MSHIPTIPRREDKPSVWTRPRGPAPQEGGGRERPSGRGPYGRDPRGGGPFGGGPPDQGPPKLKREPIFTMPTSVIVMVALLAVVHAVRSQLGYYRDLEVLAWFAFIPARYTMEWAMLPGGIYAGVWTFVTYALLHGSLMHIITNAIWLLAFGSAVARRFGALRFWLFSAAAAAGGAAVHLAMHPGETIPVVGASAAIAGQMAAAARFVFDDAGPLMFRHAPDDARYRRPAGSLIDVFRNRKALAFIMIWFAINLLVGLGGNVGAGATIAWEAHIGGFLVGLLAFRLFDPVR
ncbi:MAG: rhomboid family intramembrane serine protease [Pseudomonadota bacterium]